MIKHGIAGGLAALFFLAAPDANAQDRFGKGGQFVLSAERLFGVVVTSSKEEEAGIEETTSYTVISLFSSPFNTFFTNYSFARMGADYLVADSISIGGALAYFTASGTVEQEGQPDQDTATTSGFLLAPRIGFAHMFQGAVGIWPRAGVTYLRAGTENDEGTFENSANRFAVTLEAPLVITPAPHAMITIGPTLDLGVSGSDETSYDDPTISDTEEDVTGTDYGLQAGLGIFF